MTNEEMLARLSAETGETNTQTLQFYLDVAGERVCRKAYPFHPGITTVPAIYQSVQMEAAIYLLNKRGAEGQTHHNENGIVRIYESASIPDSILKPVIPHCGVVFSANAEEK